MTRTALRLPEFPWDALAPFAETAQAHEGGAIDLSIGSPVDTTPHAAREALAAASDSHGYPLAAGSIELRTAIVEWYARRRDVADLTVANVMPSIGSKELIGLLPLLLGVGRDDVVVHPAVAYPTYAIGAALVGASVLASDDPAAWPENTALVWVNSPSNPTGQVRDVEWLRAAVERARQIGAVIASDECYAGFDFASDMPTPSILDRAVITGDRTGVLALYSLSKQSNLAGYRAGILAGCSDLVGEILAVRRHVGLIPPAPVQAAMVAALRDDAAVARQKETYRARRDVLAAALTSAGYRIDGSRAGLYLWVTTGADCWASLAEFAARGILVAPGSFYGENGATHVRLALTATDTDIAEAARRIARDL